MWNHCSWPRSMKSKRRFVFPNVRRVEVAEIWFPPSPTIEGEVGPHPTLTLRYVIVQDVSSLSRCKCDMSMPSWIHICRREVCNCWSFSSSSKLHALPSVGLQLHSMLAIFATWSGASDLIGQEKPMSVTCVLLWLLPLTVLIAYMYLLVTWTIDDMQPTRSLKEQ